MHKCKTKILKSDCKIIMENTERLVIWKKYIEELYRSDSTGKGLRHKTSEVENGNQDPIGSSIMIENIELVIK